MHRDVKNGLFLGLLLVGVVGALFFRRDTDHHELVLPDIQDVHELDAAIADKPLIPYITGGTSTGNDVAVNKPVQRPRPAVGNVSQAKNRRNAADDENQAVAIDADKRDAAAAVDTTDAETAADENADNTLVRNTVENRQTASSKSTASDSENRIITAKSNATPVALPPAAATVADDGVVSRSRRNTPTPRHNDSWTVPVSTGTRTPAPIAMGGSLTSTVERPEQSVRDHAAPVHSIAQSRSATPSQSKAPARDGAQSRIGRENGNNDDRELESRITGSESDDAAPIGITYTTQPGDTLSSVAARFLGSSGRYNDLFLANREILNDPNVLPEGVTLRIPTRSSNGGTGNATAPARRQPSTNIEPKNNAQTEPSAEPITSDTRDDAVGGTSSQGATGSMFAPAGKSPLKTLRRVPNQRINTPGVDRTNPGATTKHTGKRPVTPIDSVPEASRPQTPDPGLPAIDTQVLESELGLDD